MYLLTGFGKGVVIEFGIHDLEGNNQLMARSRVILLELKVVIGVSLSCLAAAVGSEEVTEDTWSSAGIKRSSAGGEGRCKDGGDGGELHSEVLERFEDWFCCCNKVRKEMLAVLAAGVLLCFILVLRGSYSCS
jgi:hypothetical protein